jgi:hypothetical protein
VFSALNLDDELPVPGGITPFDQLNINKSEAFIIPINKYLVSISISGCRIDLTSLSLMVLLSVPSAGRRRGSSAPRPDPTERS